MVSLINDIGVEFSRLRRRRATWIFLIVGVLVFAALLIFPAINAAPPSAADYQRAEQQAAADADYFAAQLEECLENPAEYGIGDDWTCEDSFSPPTAEDYLHYPEPEFIPLFQEINNALTGMLAVLLAILAMTFIGADFSSGTIGTQLLYQPQRTRLFVAKAAMLGLVGVIAGSLGAVGAWVTSYVVASKWGTTDMVQHIDRQVPSKEGTDYQTIDVDVTSFDVAVWGLRGAALVAIAALAAYALATLFRSSLVALGIFAAYGIVGETLIRGLIRSMEPYLLSSRMMGWLSGPYQIVQWPNSCIWGPNDDGCAPIIHDVTVTSSGIYFAVLLAVALGLGWWSFTRRDVN